MTDSFGTFLKGSNRRGLQDALSLPRLILAAVVDSESPLSEADLVETTGKSADDVRKSLQTLAGEGLVTAKPEKGGLVVSPTQRGRVVRAS
jgi:DNA-binding GntR family transcriptional regulator